MDPLPIREVVEIVGGRWVPGPDPGFREAPPAQVSGVSTDSRSIGRGDLFVPIRGDRFDGHDFVADVVGVAAASFCAASRAAEIIQRLREQGACLGLIVVEDTLDALERLASWYRRQLRVSVIGITGSVGKTTVKEFVGQVLALSRNTVRARKSFNNRLGVALTLLSADDRTRNLVVEMGTSAPGEISRLTHMAAPDATLITSVAPAHLEGLGSLDGVVEAKAEIFDGLGSRGVAFIPDPIYGASRFLRRAHRATDRVRRFGWARTASDRSGYWVSRCRPLSQIPGPGGLRLDRPGFLFEVNGSELFELPVPGRHNVFNALASIAVARELGIGWQTIRQGLCSLRLPPLRLELSRLAGITILDDTYNANPASLRGAMEAIRELPRGPGTRWYSVIGDFLELGPSSALFHREMGAELGRSKLFQHVWTVGEQARELARGASLEGLSSEVWQARKLDRLMERVVEQLHPGDGILFKASRGMSLERGSAYLRRLLLHRARRYGPARTGGKHALLTS